jgi:transcriptional regulator with XRE-family HTH domain
MDEVGSRLRWARERAGLSQLEVAVRAGLHVRTIHNIETGKKSRCRLTTFFRLADALGVSPYWLMSGDDASGPGADVMDHPARRSA